MATVGDAYVNIRASGDNLRRDIKNAMDSGVSAAESSGSQAGEAFGESFGDAVSSSVREALQGAGSDAFESIVTRASETADSISSSFDNIDTSNLNNQANRNSGALQDLTLAALGLGEILDGLGDPGGSGFLPNLGEAALVAEGGIRDLEVGIEGAGRAINNVEKSGGGGGFLNWITGGATEARKWLDNLVSTGNFLSAGIFQLVGAIGALLTSLFSIGSAVGAAIPSLIALGGALASLVQGAVAFGIAWQGVSAAIGDGLKLQTNAGKQSGRNARSQISNARAIEAAQRALRDAYQRQADSAEKAAKRVASAEQDLADAQAASEQAQLSLTAAREAGAESLQQLAFSAEEAALAEESAGIALEKAVARLKAVQSLPPDSRTRREAELAFKEAELNYREAKDKNADLAKEQDKASKAGVEGTREVIDAKNNIIDADNKVIESQQKLNDAINQQQKDAAKAAQDVADALRQLELARKSSAGAAAGAASAVNKYQTALSDLAPAQREFVRFIVSLGPLFRTLKSAVADGVFPPLTAALQELFKNTDSTSFFGMLKSSLSETGAIVGEFLGSLVNLMNDPFFKGVFFDIIRNNNAVLKTLSGAFTDIAAALLVVFDAAGPVTQRFADWFGTLAKGWRDSATAPGALGKLTDFFNKAGDAAGKVFDVFGDFFDMVMALAETALPAGTSLLEGMSLAFQGLTGEIKGNKDGLGSFFNGAAANASVVMDVLGDFGRVLFSFADNRGISDTAEAFRPLAPIVKQIGDAMIKAGPAFARVAVAVGDLILQFVNSGQLEKFFNTFTNVINFVTKILKTGFGKALIGVLGGIAAIFIPLRILGRLAKKVFLAEIGYYVDKVKKGLEKLGFIEPTEKFEASMKRLTAETNRTLENIEQLLKISTGLGDVQIPQQGMLGFNPIDDENTPVGTRARRAVQDAGRGAKLGATVGSAIPVVGSAVGAAVGAGGALAARGVGAVGNVIKAKLGRRKQNLAEGLESRPDPFSGAGKDAADNWLEGFDDGAGIDSPSRQMMKRAKYLIDGLKIGLNQSSGSAINSAKNVANDIDSQFEKVSKKNRKFNLGGMFAGAKGKIGGAFGKIGGAVGKIGGAVKEKVGGMGGGAKSALKGGALAGIGAVVAIIKNPKMIDDLIAKVVDFAGKLPQALAKVATKIPQLLSAVVKAIGPIIKAIVAAFPGIIKAIVKEVPKLIGTIAAALPGVIKTIAAALPTVIGALAALLPKVISAIAGALPLVISGIAKALPALIQGIASALPKVLNAIVGAIPIIIKAITDALPIVLDALLSALPMIINAIFTALPQIVIALANALPLIIGTLVKAIPMLLDAIIKAVPLIIKGLITALPLILKAVVGILPAIIKQVVTIFKGSEGLGKIIDWFSQLPGKIADFLWKGDNSLLGKIKELPGKITNATKNMFTGIYNAWATVINGMIEFWNKLELKVGGWEGNFFGRKLTFPTVKLETPDIPWRMPKLAKGGIVNPKNGGTMALLAEAGRAERITPLDAQGFTPAERAILQALSDNAEKEVNIQVFVGNQQIQDIVDVKMNGKSIRDARRTNYSRPVN